MKYQLGQKIMVDCTITGASLGKRSSEVHYNTNAGLCFTESELDRLIANNKEPINIVGDTRSCAPKQEDKPKFKSGDRIIGVRKDWNTGVKGTVLNVGSRDLLVSFDKYVDPSFPRGEDKFCAYQGEIDIEPYTEPSQPSLIVTREMLVELGACDGGLKAFDRLFPSGKEDFNIIYDIASHDGECRREEYHDWLLRQKSRIEPTQNQPKHEAVTLYCKQDYGENSHYSITKGNVYSIIDGVMTYDNGVKSNSVYGSFKEYKEWHSDFAACLTKTEKRPAKKGEYILITKSKDTRVKAGDVYKFVDSGSFDEDIFVEHPEGKRAKDGAADISPSEYLVLPDYIPEKVEPTYWSGKVVCTESQNIGATAGKAYSVVNGLFTWNNGVKYSSRNFTSFDNFKEIMKKHATDFIEYLGEQSC